MWGSWGTCCIPAWSALNIPRSFRLTREDLKQEERWDCSGCIGDCGYDLEQEERWDCSGVCGYIGDCSSAERATCGCDGYDAEDSSVLTLRVYSYRELPRYNTMGGRGGAGGLGV